MGKEYGKSVVDVESLSDFRTALDTHHDAVCAMLSTMENHLLDVTPKLGGFPDARDLERRYSTVTGGYHNRIKRLKVAIEAAQQATDSIMHKYKTTEDRNHSNADVIARTVRPVAVALGDR